MTIVAWIFHCGYALQAAWLPFTKGLKGQSLLIVNVVLILLGYNGVKFDKKVCQKAILKGKVALMSF